MYKQNTVKENDNGKCGSIYLVEELVGGNV